MSGWLHAGLTCDGCGEVYCCSYESVVDTREHAAEREDWQHRSSRRASDGRRIWRDLCAGCAKREDAER